MPERVNLYVLTTDPAVSAVDLRTEETLMTRSLPAALVLALLASLLAVAPAVAQTSGERIPAMVKTGQRVSIVDEDGRQIDGRVEGISEEAIRLSQRRGTEEIPVDRIVRIDRPDSLKNGALIGLGVGLTNSAIWIGFATQAENVQWKIVFASSAASIVGYTLLGTGIDAIFNNRRTLYQRGGRAQARVSPVVGRGVRGAAVSLTW